MCGRMLLLVGSRRTKLSLDTKTRGEKKVMMRRRIVVASVFQFISKYCSNNES